MALPTQFSNSSQARSAPRRGINMTHRGPPPLLYHDILRGINLSRSGELIITVTAISYLVWLAFGAFSRKLWWFWWVLPLTAVPFALNALIVIIVRRLNVRVVSRASSSSVRNPSSKYSMAATNSCGSLASETAWCVLSMRIVVLALAYSAGAHLFFGLAKAVALANMSWTYEPQPYIPRQVNERNLYVSAFASYLGLCYALYHQYRNYDMLHFAVRYIPRLPRKRLLSLFFPDLALDSIAVATVSSLSFPLVYAVFARKLVWTMALWMLKLFMHTSLSRNDDYVRFPGRPGLVLHLAFTTSFLVFIWEMANHAFTIYTTGGPRHKFKFVSEVSNDPNGTLLTGLKARSGLSSDSPMGGLSSASNTNDPLAGLTATRILAYQELLYIAEHDAGRRKMIYQDIDRYPKSMWSQILSTSLAQLDSIAIAFKNDMGLVENNSGGQAKKNPNEECSAKIGGDNASISDRSPQISERIRPLREERRNVLLSQQSTSKAYKLAASVQDKDAQVSAEAIRMFTTIWGYAQQHVVANRILEQFLQTRFGFPFRQSVDRRLERIIPNSTFPVTVLLALEQLVCNSLTEDMYGTVQRDVSTLLNNLDSLMSLIEKFIAEPPIHWTDVIVKQGTEKPNVSRASGLLQALESVFGRIVETFEDYLNELDLSARVRQRAHNVLHST